MSGAIALLCLIGAGVLYFAARIVRQAMRRHRPGLPPPDRACVRDCFKPVARH